MRRLTRWFDKLTVSDTRGNVWGLHAAPIGWRQGFVALLAVGLLSGCGQSGPLTLPSRGDAAASAPVAESPIAPEPEASPGPEPEASPGPESEASPGPESETSPGPESEASPEPESEASPGLESEALSEEETDDRGEDSQQAR